MSNPLAQRFGVANQPRQKTIAEQFREFRQSFKGNPQAKINELLANGQVSQEQVNNAMALAQMIASKRRRK